MKKPGELALRYHHWFGVVCCLAVMSWGASGVLHPIMSRLSPQPVEKLASVQRIALHDALDPAEVLTGAGIDQIAGLRAIVWKDTTYYQVTLPDQSVRRYFDVRNGAELADGDRQYAAYLAQHFTRRSAATVAESIPRFDHDYLSVNRLLPVWRVDLAGADGLRAYVETSPPRLAALVDDNKATLGTLFRWLHTWDFFATRDTLRVALITAMLALVLLSALSGIWMYASKWQRGTLRKQHPALRRWHRGLGMTISISALMFASSAAWHLLHGYGQGSRESPPPARGAFAATAVLLPDALRHAAWQSLTLVEIDGEPAYLLTTETTQQAAASGEHDHHPARTTRTPGQPPSSALYLRASDGSIIADAERRHAVRLAGQYSNQPQSRVANVSLITRFEGEYGFLNKRLPVWRVDYATADHAAYYVETGSGALATVVHDADRWEGWSFAYLHKFHWLDFAGKDVHDIVSALFALGNLLVSMLGLWMFARR